MSGRAWLITGASSGLGRAMAEAALTRGDRVAACARSLDRLGGFLDSGDRLLPLALDVRDASSIDAAVEAMQARFGDLDVLVNNAGHGLLGAVEETSEAQARDLFETNFFGLAALTRRVLPAMRARRSGTIVNVSSVAGFVGMPGSGFYAASKFAVEGLSDALRAEAAEFGVRVLVVEPSAFRTGFFDARRHTDTPSLYAAVEARRTTPIAVDGDPIRAAAIILDTLDQPTLPHRLLLGRQAAELAASVIGRRLQEAQGQAILAASADHPKGA